MKTQNTRLYYIDWLRVLAFGLLFLFHSWRPFDHFSWSIKNAAQSNFFDILTLFTHGWRMDLIFLVSGVGAWFALNSRKSHFQFDRMKRLIIPFIFGVIFIVPPQKFYEAISFNGFQGNYFEFLKAYPAHLFSSDFGYSILLWFGHIGSHIYYLPYLFTMMLLTVPLYKIVKKRKYNFKKLERLILTPWGIFLLILPMFFTRIILKPLFPTYTDWADFFTYAWMFLYGFIFIKNTEFVEILKRRMWLFLNIGIISSVLFIYFIARGDVNMEAFMRPKYDLNHLYISAVSVFISFGWVMFFVGLAAKKLNFNHQFLLPANTSILPVYILHQTIIIVFGYYIIQWNISIFTKYLLIAGLAIPSSVLIYLLIKKVNFLRFVFGLKTKKVKTHPEIVQNFA